MFLSGAGPRETCPPQPEGARGPTRRRPGDASASSPPRLMRRGHAAARTGTWAGSHGWAPRLRSGLGECAAGRAGLRAAGAARGGGEARGPGRSADLSGSPRPRLLGAGVPGPEGSSAPQRRLRAGVGGPAAPSRSAEEPECARARGGGAPDLPATPRSASAFLFGARGEGEGGERALPL